MEVWKNKVVVVLDDLQLCIASRLAIFFLLPQKYLSSSEVAMTLTLKTQPLGTQDSTHQ